MTRIRIKGPPPWAEQAERRDLAHTEFEHAIVDLVAEGQKVGFLEPEILVAVLEYVVGRLGYGAGIEPTLELLQQTSDKLKALRAQ